MFILTKRPKRRNAKSIAVACALFGPSISYETESRMITLAFPSDDEIGHYDFTMHRFDWDRLRDNIDKTLARYDGETSR